MRVYSTLWALCILFASAVGASAQTSELSSQVHSFDVLVFSKTAGYRHASIEKGIEAIQQLGLDNGFNVDATEDASAFTTDNLQNYAAIIFLCTTGDVLNLEQQSAFQSYIQQGGGFVGIHAASDTEYSWPWYGELVGAYFDSHPEIQQATIEVADRVHPSTSHLPEYWIRTDEWYNYSENPRGDVHVLATLDEATYSGGSMGHDHPFAWMHEFEGGRSWYTGGGHTEESYSEPDFLQHILGGIFYASGDVKGEFDATSEQQYQVTVIKENPAYPMALAVLPSYDVLYIERQGKMHLWNSSTGLISTAAEFDVDSGREDGLLGIVLDPNFEINSYIYVFYSPRTVEEQRVSRFTFDGVRLNMDSEDILLRIPVQRSQCCHSGGDLEFGPNGDLYITTGDNVNPFESDGFSPIDERPGREYYDAQGTSGNTMDLRGKILRIRPEEDGTYSIPEGNLFTNSDEGLPEIYVMGTRNPFRMAVDKRNGELYWGDVGPDAGGDNVTRGPKGYDEFNRTTQAGNFGWPMCIAENLPYRQYDFATGTTGAAFNCDSPVNSSPNNTGADSLPPAIPAWIAYTYGVTEKWPQLGAGQRTAIAGDIFYYDDTLEETGSLPEYFDGSLFILEWTRNWIKEIRFTDDGELLQINPFLDNLTLNRPIDMKIGPDGAIYIIEWGTGFFEENADDRIIKIEFAQNLANRVPTARAAVDIQSGSAPLSVIFSGETSSDPDVGDVLRYSWDLDGDDVEDANTATVQYTYNTNGVYPVTLTVTDQDGATSVDQLEIIVGNTAPVVTILEPYNGGFYEDFDEIEYSVDVMDAEQGSIGNGIDCQDVAVEPSIGHDDHAHGTGPRNGCTGIFTTETHGEGPDNVFYVLAATYDDDGAGVGASLRGSDGIVLNMKRKQAQHAVELIDLQTETTGDVLGGGQNVGFANQNSAMKFSSMNFEGIDFITLRYASNQIAAEVEVRVDSLDGELISTIGTQTTGDWQAYDFFTSTLQNPGGTRDVYVVFKSDDGNSALGNINWIDFHGKGVAKTHQDSLRGLAATYYSEPDFTGTQIVRKDPMIAFQWDDRGAHETLPKEGFSVRWEGELTVDAFGFYKLFTDAVNGKARVWLDDQILIDEDSNESGNRSLQANTPYKLKVEYSHTTGESGMFLRWNRSSSNNVIHADFLTPSAEVLLVSNTSTAKEIPQEFSLRQNYPNPFNPTTNIKYTLPHAGAVTLSVFNTLGQEVGVLVQGTQVAGTHQVQFDGTQLTSGTYFYQLDFEGQSRVRSFLLLK
ncbi:MAG: carbohydrate-binding protein [Rhodothermaceae bacterium TMED105]|nr:MAG: carbohydrate-binding protein [Rhodothermaceae bacterium TMED105]